MSSSKKYSCDFALDRFLISFSGTVAVAFYPSCGTESSDSPMAAIFKVSNGLVLATLDTSSLIKPSDIKRAERMVNNLIVGLEPDLSFEPLSDEIFEAASNKVVFLLIQRHYPVIKKGAMSWLVDKALFRAKLNNQKSRTVDEHFSIFNAGIRSAAIDQSAQYISDAQFDQDEINTVPKGILRIRKN